jgi:hypothetical protein
MLRCGSKCSSEGGDPVARSRTEAAAVEWLRSDLTAPASPATAVAVLLRELSTCRVSLCLQGASFLHNAQTRVLAAQTSRLAYRDGSGASCSVGTA